VNGVKEFATQFQEGIKGAQDVAGHVKQVSSILQLITSNSTLQSAAAAVYTVAAGVEENLGKVSSGLSTVLKPFNIVKIVVDVGKGINDKVLTPLTTTQFGGRPGQRCDEQSEWCTEARKNTGAGN
jgi:hypothetical protein